MKHTSYAIAALFFTLGLAGCESTHKGVMPGKPATAPPYPKPVPMAIDPGLQDKAQKEIQSASHSQDQLIRAHALETMKDLHWPDIDQAVVAGLEDPSVLVRKAAAYVAGELKIQAALPLLPELLNTESSTDDAVSAEQERMAGIFALHRLGNTKYTHELENTANDSRAHIRAETAFIFGMLGEPSATPMLLQMVNKDADTNVRLEAGEALWRLGDERGESALVSATISSYASDQMIAYLALAERHDTRMLGHIEAGLTADYPEVCLVAARAAGMLGSGDGYGVVLKGADSVDPRQRALAAMAFGAIGRPDSQPRLAKLLKDSEPDVRLAAAGSLIQIAEKQ